ncbi:AsmA family protein [Roseivirga spongicola]|uniref:AsmA family protein n=1 Tax=Roseivirga spongicola TaxID=333140 RepID=UPI002AC8EC54|nr:AsmA-like C-terminal region-containing protein [Roseivirga spongicola]WPZ11325.1 AsmA-like C-terminal region-containing protein [Roseivirga spongicola]
MKKVLKIFVGFLLVIFIAILLIPVFFKGKIKELIMSEFSKNTEASLYFDDFNLSLIRNFPNFTLSLDNMGIIGTGVFEQDTLFKVGELSATVNMKEVLFGDEISLKSVSADGADITIIVLQDGTANYDIAKASEAIEEQVEDEESASVSLGLESISITNSEFVYFDQGLGYFMQLSGMNVKGEGDFANDIFDLKTTGRIDDVEVTYQEVDYLHNKSIDLDVVLSMDLTNSKYTFKDNVIKVNDFPLSADGSFTMLEDGYGMDLSFSSPGAEFKQLLSLVPPAYLASFDELQATGNLSFAGALNGIYSDDNMPAFNFGLNIKDGNFKYPDLPDAIKNVQLSVAIDNKTGVIEDTRIDLQDLHLEMGSNPLDAKLLIENLRDYRMTAAINGQLNLSEVGNYYPMDGYAMRGLINIKADASGVYDSVRNIVPKMDIGLSLENGYIKTPDVPSAIENLTLAAGVINKSGQMADTEINVDNLSLNLDGQEFVAQMKLVNPDNFSWNVKSSGSLDLEKLMAIYPMEGMQLKGKVNTNLQSNGNMKDLEAQRYSRLPTSGDLVLTDFSYKGDAVEQEITISNAEARFDNNAITLANYSGKAGSTSYKMNGKIENYLGFALNDEVLTGVLSVEADQLNVNEWMTDSDDLEETTESGEPLEVVRIPENVVFNLTTRVNQVKYNSLTLNNMAGRVEVKNGAVALNNAGFDALNGKVSATGEYDSKPEKPTFDFKFGAKEISIPASFQSIDMVQKMAPVTQNMTGLFSTDFNIKGALGSDMMPDYGSLTGGGLIQILQASLGQSNLLSGLASVTKLSDVGAATLDKVKMTAEIKDGRLFVKPFDLNLGDYKTTIAGSTGIDGSIDYTLAMNVPAGQVGAQLNSLVSSLTGTSNKLTGDNLILNIGMGGVFSDPKFSLKSIASADGSGIKQTVQASVEAKVEEKKEEVKQEVQEKVDAAKDSARQVIQAKTDTAKAKIDSLLQSRKDSIAAVAAGKLGVEKDSVDKKLEEVKEKAKGVLEGLLKKKKKQTKKEDEDDGGRP